MLIINPVGAILGMTILACGILIIGYLAHKSEQEMKKEKEPKIILPP